MSLDPTMSSSVRAYYRPGDTAPGAASRCYRDCRIGRATFYRRTRANLRRECRRPICQRNIHTSGDPDLREAFVRPSKSSARRDSTPEIETPCRARERIRKASEKAAGGLNQEDRSCPRDHSLRREEWREVHKTACSRRISSFLQGSSVADHCSMFEGR